MLSVNQMFEISVYNSDVQVWPSSKVCLPWKRTDTWYPVDGDLGNLVTSLPRLCSLDKILHRMTDLFKRQLKMILFFILIVTALDSKEMTTQGSYPKKDVSKKKTKSIIQ